MTLGLQENRLSGTLPKWAGLTQASHAAQVWLTVTRLYLLLSIYCEVAECSCTLVLSHADYEYILPFAMLKLAAEHVL